jgi:hypothetical protein
MNRSGTIRAAHPNDPSAREYQQQQHNAVTDFVPDATLDDAKF